MVNHWYFYGFDADFGPFYKFCGYFPFTGINGHEYAMRSVRKAGIAFTAETRSAAPLTRRRAPPGQGNIVFGRLIRLRGKNPAPGSFRTQVITSGVCPYLYLYYKKTQVKQYLKEQRRLRARAPARRPACGAGPPAGKRSATRSPAQAPRLPDHPAHPAQPQLPGHPRRTQHRPVPHPRDPAVPHPRTGPAHRHRPARLTAAPGRPRLQGRDHQPRPAGIHHRLTTTVTTADPRPAPGVTHAAT